MSSVSRISLKKVRSSKKYSWKDRVHVHLNTARVKYARLSKSKAAVVAREPVTDFSDDVGYFGPVTLGGQQFQQLFDTGSSDLWVPGVGFNNGASTTHSTFNPKNSSTFQTDNTPFSITYGLGSTSGIAATDTFSIAGLSVDNQAFGLADTISDDFTNSPFDGILGLGFEALSQLQAPTPFQNLVSDDDVSSSVFSFLLGREKDGTQSEFILGGLDPKFASNVNNNNVVNQQGFWIIDLGGAQVNNKAIQVSSTQAVIDTGTTLVIIPSNDADAIHNAIPGATKQSGTYLVPTNTTAVVSIIFGGVTYNINTKDLVGDDAGNGLSTSGIQGDTVPGMEGTWLVGDVFLKNVFSAFDISKRTVGFAPNE